MEEMKIKRERVINEARQSIYLALIRVKDNYTEGWQLPEERSGGQFIEFLRKKLEYAKKFKLIADESWLNQSLDKLGQVLSCQEVDKIFTEFIKKLE